MEQSIKQRNDRVRDVHADYKNMMSNMNMAEPYLVRDPIFRIGLVFTKNFYAISEVHQ